MQICLCRGIFKLRRGRLCGINFINDRQRWHRHLIFIQMSSYKDSFFPDCYVMLSGALRVNWDHSVTVVYSDVSKRFGVHSTSHSFAICLQS